MRIHENLRSVQGRDGDEVEGSEHDVDLSHIVEESVNGAGSGKSEEAQEEEGDEGKEYVHRYAC